MPRGDGRGPNGMGPMSGRAAGGRGNRNMFFATGLTGRQRASAGFSSTGMSPVQELAFLRQQGKHMEEALQKTRERIAELEKKEGKE
jgi:hypothetical protein